MHIRLCEDILVLSIEDRFAESLADIVQYALYKFYLLINKYKYKYHLYKFPDILTVCSSVSVCMLSKWYQNVHIEYNGLDKTVLDKKYNDGNYSFVTILKSYYSVHINNIESTRNRGRHKRWQTNFIKSCALMFDLTDKNKKSMGCNLCLPTLSMVHVSHL